MEYLNRKVKSNGQIDTRQMNGASNARKKLSETAMSPAPPAPCDKNTNKSEVGKQSLVGSRTSKYDMERDRIGVWGSGDGQSNSRLSGLDRLKHPGLNKGMAFSIEERQAMGIHGLLPPRVKTQEEQVQLCKLSIDRYEDPLNKYIYLMGLLDRNEHLFYRFVGENVAEMMPIVYTPTVGLACQKYGLVYRRPRGLFITINDKGYVYDILKNWPETDVRAIVVTDGERILGLGDLGACGMGIPVGKLALYTALAGIKPHQCLPITIDVGTNNQGMLDDPLYIGLRQRRVRGPQYDELIQEFMEAVVKRYGQNCLVQFEDFGNANAFRLLEKYRGKYCTFNDDIQGTAAVAVAGLLASLRVTNKQLSDNVIVFQGAGEASLGIAELCVMAMKAEGTSEEDARGRIFMVDSKGLIVKNRPEGGLNEHKEKFAKDCPPIRTLAEVVEVVKPSVLIGAAAIGGAFTPSILRAMGDNNQRPVVFALSNPTSKAECTAEEAYVNTDERAIFASGSPFPDYRTKDGRVLRPGQGNNAYIFPGLALGILCAGLVDVSEDFMLLAAEALADIVSQENLDQGSLYPPLEDIQECSVKIAKKIVEHAYATGKASVQPPPLDTEAFIRSQMYDVRYGRALPPVYDWPHDAPKVNVL
ncbi:NADP-dependent malic enzyme-like isoform X1 [Danaus plexippus]|uniref:NADP-dependent malic enzyme-like isoform X1 n=2 Tax=Danaus plexippus TaxID=13037 RepID=UPI002AAFFF55|nr:NADP-dependent malic enzyme-like isoform X1 [Danaus plexippus]